ncbi:MAG: multicopper oxidase domain-containing protein, partial [Myxococcota bacterium]
MSRGLLVALLFLSVAPALARTARADAESPSAAPPARSVVEATLTIARERIEVAGVVSEGMTVNGSIPGPTLRWRVGDLARIRVTNTMDVPTSVHWHGLLLPNAQDGVPGLTTPGIRPGGTHVFEIPIRHAGTYWYHSHTALQEQRGVYGAIVIEPAERPARSHRASHAESTSAADRDVVLVLSDWTRRDPAEILRLLKRGSEYFSVEKGTAQSLWGALRAGELGSVFRRSLRRMPPMDLSDVAYDAFLVNGSPVATIDARPGERLRLRVINAAASTYFFLGIAGRPFEIVAADGVDVRPLVADRLLMAIAETYDLVVEVPEEGRLEFRATAQDGSGSASAWLGQGPDLPARPVPRPNLYAMRHPASAHHEGGHDRAAPRSEKTPPAATETHHPPSHAGHAMPAMDPEAHGEGHEPPAHGARSAASEAPARPLPPYARLRSRVPSTLPPEAPTRTIRLRLTGNMDRYIWSFDGKTLAEADVIPVRRGEVLRVELENTTMMHHPLHLHGHFFRVLERGAARANDPFAPLKHTVDVAPMQTTTIEFLADAEGDWLFHCHVLYHMKAGMTRLFHYEDSAPDPALAEEREKLFADPIYAWAEASGLSQFTEGEILASNRRHELGVEWEIGYRDGVDREVLPRYRYHLNRFYRFFAGASLEDERDVAVFGAEALLPLNFGGRAWIDTRGHGRFALDKTLDLTTRLGFVGDVEYDTEQGFEGSAGLRYRVHRNAAIAAEWHSEFG